MSKTYGYEYVHILLKKHRGRAAEYQCVDCPKPAQHWSLSADAEIIYQIGTKHDGNMYSLDLEDYEPRCRKCHYAYDKKNELMRGPDGNRSGRTRTSLMVHPEVCIVDGCERTDHKARGKCTMHYAQEYREEQRKWTSEVSTVLFPTSSPDC